HVVGQPVGIHSLDRLDDTGVQDAAALVEQSAIRHLVRQRMRERVLDLGEELRLIEELRGAQPIEPPAEGLVRELGDVLKDRTRNVVADDGGRLQQALVVRSEAVDTRRQHGLNRRWHLELVDRLHQAIPSRLADQQMRLLQRPDDLLQEERVPVDDEESLEWFERAIGAEERVQELAGALDAERTQPQLREVRLIAPGVPVVGTMGGEQQYGRRREPPGEVVEERLRLDVDPLKIFDDQEERSLARLAQQQSAHRLERAPPTFGGIERPPPGVLVDLDVEQGEQRRQRRLQRFVEREHLPRHLLANLPAVVAIVDREVCLEEI